MAYRDLFNRIMHYEDFTRMPVLHWGGWPETITRWEKEGLPSGNEQCAYLDADPLPPGLPVNLDLFPPFEPLVYEETDDYVVMQQADGVTAKLWKHKSSIPRYLDYKLKDRASWEEYKRRLLPSPERIAPDFIEVAERYRASGWPLHVFCGSLIGYIRNWMGVEGLAYLIADDPLLLCEMVDHYTDMVCWVLDQVLPHVQVDLGWGWEDICFRSGPLVSPDTFKQAAVPGYRKISEKLRSYGCDLYLVDCDGKIDDLVPLWLEGGVNIMFPVEIGVWHADPAVWRKQYGKELRFIGAFDKLVLERDFAAIDAELERRKPLMAEGGFIPLPDHLITPDTPLDNLRYYLDRLRELRF